MQRKKIVKVIDTILSGEEITPQGIKALKDLREQLKPSDAFTERGTKVLSRNRDMEGITTGGTRPCAMEGCTGIRIAVMWPDGKITYPCSKGLGSKDGKYQII